MFHFSCVPREDCQRKDTSDGIVVKGSDLLSLKVALAETANYDEPDHVCCHENDLDDYDEYDYDDPRFVE